MSKLNIASIAATAYRETSELATRSFHEAFGILSRLYSRRLQIERDALGKSFNSETFWNDNSIAEQVIESTFKRPKVGSDGKPVLRKGAPVYETNRFNKREVANAASIVRSGCRSRSALAALLRKHGSEQAAVANADKLGSVLGLVPRLAACGLCKTNADANDAKNAAITAYTQPGEVTTGAARRALIGSLYGKPVTSEQVKTVLTAMTAWATERATARAASKPEPEPLKFAVVLGKVVSITRERTGRSHNRSNRANRSASGAGATTETTGTEQPATEQPEPELKTGTNN